MDGDGPSVRADPGRGGDGLPGGAGGERDPGGALNRYRDRALRRGRPRGGREHRCAGEAGRLEDPGGRGDNPDPDLPRGAPLTAARSGRTAALTPNPKRTCLRECPFRTNLVSSPKVGSSPRVARSRWQVLPSRFVRTPLSPPSPRR